MYATCLRLHVQLFNHEYVLTVSGGRDENLQGPGYCPLRGLQFTTQHFLDHFVIDHCVTRRSYSDNILPTVNETFLRNH